MDTRRFVHWMAVCLLLTLPLFGTAGAAAGVLILEPADGATISHTTALPVSGAVSFADPVQEDRTFYQQRTQCASGDDDAHLALGFSGGQSNGCTFLAQPLNEVLILLGDEGLMTTYQAQQGVPFALDAGKPIEGRVVMSGLATAGAGLATVEIWLEGMSGNSLRQIGATEQTYPVAASNVTVNWSMQPSATLDKLDFTSLSLRMRVRGVNVGHGGVNHASGNSRFTIGVWDPSPNTAVQLSFNPNFAPASAVRTATLAGDGTWAGTIPTPGTGERTLHARALQGGVVVATDQVNLTVVQ